MGHIIVYGNDITKKRKYDRRKQNAHNQQDHIKHHR